ncbi:hypothetical protein BKA64DRAFT_711555 [Cadophora sp. MPI-SDFR-AT-0126]|nr:hypothetical protein BKA64DRAFT_711555 [Leotiomycetes sp. MPI-SDFR-AT-0126]
MDCVNKVEKGIWELTANLTAGLDKENKWKAWAIASYDFSMTAIGNVHMVLPAGRPMASMPSGEQEVKEPFWERFEAWAITRPDGEAMTITRNDAENFDNGMDEPTNTEGRVIWTRGVGPQLGKAPDFVTRPVEDDPLNENVVYHLADATRALWRKK